MTGTDDRYCSRRHARGVLAALVLTAALVAGCGSSSKPTTVAQFKREITAECSSIRSDKAAAAKVAAIDKSTGSTAKKSEEILAFTAPYYKKFSAIAPPAKDATAEQMHVAYVAVSKAIASVASAAGDSTALNSASATIRTDETILRNDYAKIGATACE